MPTTRNGGSNDAPTETPAGAETSTPPADAAVAPATGTAPAPDADTGGTAAGADGKPKRIALADMRDAFGPIEIPNATDRDGKPITYTITRQWTEVAGEHVQHVRDMAKHSHVKLKSAAAQS